jgi:hypothetical protein
LDTATDLSGHMGSQDGHVQDSVSGLTGRGVDGHGQTVPEGEYLPLAEAAAAVQRSEKTLRRLVAKGKVPNYRETTPPYRMLVEMGAVRAAVADSLAAVPFTPDAEPSRQGGQPPVVQSGHAQNEPVRDDGQPTELLHFLQNELDRLRQELAQTRVQSRSELEAKEQRIEKLTDELLSARRDAGKWEQAEEYRRQLYNDYIRLQAELGEAKLQLKLLDRNPTPVDIEGGHEVYAAARPIPEGRVVEATVSAPRAPYQTVLFWLLLLVIAGGGSFGIYWMTIPH